MPDIVGIRFKRAGKVYYFDPVNTPLKVYEYVVVQTARGVELGQITIAPKQVLASEITNELKPIVRKATPDDIKQALNFAAKEDTALAECSKLISKHKLPMKLVSAEYNLDGTRLTFYFTSEERVDFRELVRELTAYFKTRIELRQIGPRDQAKIVGGMGRCGRGLCCGSFLTEFNPVSIKMAKEQDLPLDPMKISGVCGRLQCCLAYESNQYHEIKAGMPRRGQRVSTPSGEGIVVGIFPLKDTVLVEFESQANAEFKQEQIKVIEERSRPVAQDSRETVEPSAEEIQKTEGKSPAQNRPNGQTEAPAEAAKAELPPVEVKPELRVENIPEAAVEEIINPETPPPEASNTQEKQE